MNITFVKSRLNRSLGIESSLKLDLNPSKKKSLQSSSSSSFFIFFFLFFFSVVLVLARLAMLSKYSINYEF
jgi:hypothetical protein